MVVKNVLYFDIKKLHEINAKSIILKRYKGSTFATPLTSAEYTPNRTASFPEELMADTHNQFYQTFEEYVKEQKRKFAIECELETVDISDTIYMTAPCG